ncbi:MAG: hypothetical protein ACPGSD_06775, partial [Flavobacteriales bacterium]
MKKITIITAFCFVLSVQAQDIPIETSNQIFDFQSFEFIIDNENIVIEDINVLNDDQSEDNFDSNDEDFDFVIDENGNID